MILSSGYLFAEGISGGTPPISGNVIFENGVWNANRMKAGFALESNMYIVQNVYSGIPFSQGSMAITQGGFAQQIAADDGACFVNYGTDHNLLSVENGYIKHVGQWLSSDRDGCEYFFPVNMQKMSVEGYSKMYVTLDYSQEGIPDPQAGQAGFLYLYLHYTSGNNLSTLGYNTFTCSGSPTLAEETHYITMDNDNGAPSYIRIAMSDGTYHIKKIWFE